MLKRKYKGDPVMKKVQCLHRKYKADPVRKKVQCYNNKVKCYKESRKFIQ